MKLSDNLAPNPMYTSDKIVVKRISVNETLLKLDLEPKGKGHRRQQNNKQGNQKHSTINRARIRLVKLVQLMSQTFYE